MPHQKMKFEFVDLANSEFAVKRYDNIVKMVIGHNCLVEKCHFLTF